MRRRTDPVERTSVSPAHPSYYNNQMLIKPFPIYLGWFEATNTKRTARVALTLAVSLLILTKVCQRVTPDFSGQYLEMQVRSGRVTSTAHLSDHGSFRYLLSWGCLQL